MVGHQDLGRRLEAIFGPSRVLSAEALLEPYARDESGYGRYLPQAVVLAEEAGEVSELLRLSARDRIPVTPRGLGTGKSGGALAVEGGIVLSTERMDRILEIDLQNRIAVVEPGVITGVLRQRVAEHDLFYPPDPASLEICSLGGNVAENAGGPCALKYGVTGDYVAELGLCCIGGDWQTLGRRTRKWVTGLDLVSLVVGSEGTLGVVGQIALKLLPRPGGRATFLARFPEVATAARAVGGVLRAGLQPSALELMDQVVAEHLRGAGRWQLPPERGALLLVELDGDDAVRLEGTLFAAASRCEEEGASEILVATDDRRRRELWEMRRGVSPLLKECYPAKVSEDVTVPVGAIPRMIAELEQIGTEAGVVTAAYGHAGDGNLHVNLLLEERPAQELLDRMVERIFRAAIAMGGTLSGEHGIGAAKRQFMPLEQSDGLLALQRRLKQAFDPEGLLNPGKLYV